MKRTYRRTAIGLAAILSVLIAATLFCVPAAATAESKLPGWDAKQITVSNNINEFTYDLPAYFQFNMAQAKYEIRIYSADFNAKRHYTVIDGYEMIGLSGWTLSDDGMYYSQFFASVDAATVFLNYRVRSYNVTFVDGITGAELGTYPVAHGGSVTPPKPLDYSADGMIFDGWDGGEYENVQRNTTVYAHYAAARYITTTDADGNAIKIAVPYGSTVADIPSPTDGRTVAEWMDTDGKTVPGDTIIAYDMALTPVYTGWVMPSWLRTSLIVVGSLAGATLIIWIAVRIVGRKSKRKTE